MKDLYNKFKIYGFRKFLYAFFHESYKRLISGYICHSYSQCGEDVVIDKLLGNKKLGFYIDIGAYDPSRFSNTKRFYLKGWCGINIEPDPQNFKKFVTFRKRDINLNIGIGSREATLNFFKFFPDTSSTFSKDEASRNKKQGFKLLREIMVKVFPLAVVLGKYHKNKPVDFITIDTEGYDLDVLKGNDWLKFRPTAICIEISENIQNHRNSKYQGILRFLNAVGYKKYLDNGTNSIFIDGKKTQLT